MTNLPFDPDGPPDDNPERPGPHQPDAFDELLLRGLLHDAVREVEPQSDALARLRQAVPARRTRRKQAMVGAAAGVLLVGTAVPALFHAATAGSSDSAATANAAGVHDSGSSPGAQGGAEQGGDWGASAGSVTGGGPSGEGPGGAGVQPSASASGAVPGSSAPPTDTMIATSPTCSRAQLGKGTAQAGPPDSAGRVYGSFRVVNISAASCSVPGGGQVIVAAQGNTDPTKIQVVDHTAGDPATGLPDPAMAPDAVILPPGKAYQVQFAWIPATGGGSSGCSSSSANPSTGGGTTGGAGGTAGGGNTAASANGSGGSAGTGGTPETPAGGTATPTSPANAVSVTHVPEEGAPAAATTTINGACAGTVYRTTAFVSP